MALIQCSECGNDVSDKAAACPKCGNPLSDAAALAATASTVTTAVVSRPPVGAHVIDGCTLSSLSSKAAKVATLHVDDSQIDAQPIFSPRKTLVNTAAIKGLKELPGKKLSEWRLFTNDEHTDGFKILVLKGRRADAFRKAMEAVASANGIEIERELPPLSVASGSNLALNSKIEGAAKKLSFGALEFFMLWPLLGVFIAAGLKVGQLGGAIVGFAGAAFLMGSLVIGGWRDKLQKVKLTRLRSLALGILFLIGGNLGFQDWNDNRKLTSALDMARGSYEKKDFKSAIDSYSTILDKNVMTADDQSKYIESMVQHGFALYSQKEWPSVIALFSKVVKANPSMTVDVNEQGQQPIKLFLDHARVGQAIRDAEAADKAGNSSVALAKFNEAFDVYEGLQTIFFSEVQLKQLEAAAGRIDALTEPVARTALEKGKAHVAKNNYAEAEKAFGEAEKLFKSIRDSRETEARALRQQAAASLKKQQAIQAEQQAAAAAARAAASMQEDTRKIARDIYGSGLTNVEFIKQLGGEDEGYYLVTVVYDMGDQWDGESARKGAVLKSMDFIKKMRGVPNVAKYFIRPHGKLIDKYGNESLDQVMKIVIRKAVSDRIVWDNTSIDRFERILMTDGQFWVHPALRD